jgi:hypothetical protein
MEGPGLTNQFVLYYLERKQYTNLSSVAMHCMHTFLFSTAANPQMISILSVASELARQHLSISCRLQQRIPRKHTIVRPASR